MKKQIAGARGPQLQAARTLPSASGPQLRAARALLGLSAKKLADETGLSRGTIQRAELEKIPITASNMARMVETLERLGVIFISSSDEGPGVRLGKLGRK